MRIGSLFTGYAGLDLGVRAALGGEIAWHCDNDPAAAAVLAHHWPDVPNLGDITAVDWQTVDPVDVLTGGWPCQPWSHAGQRKGADDDRALWPEVARAVREIRPRHLVLENVPGIVTAGELGRVADSLAALGHDLAWTCLAAADVGAPHRRNRVFIVATADADRLGLERPRSTRDRSARPADHSGTTTYTASHGRDQGQSEPSGQLGRLDAALGGGLDWGDYAPAIHRWEHVLGRPVPAPTQPGRRGNEQLAPAFVEWLMGLPAGHVTDAPGLSRAQQLRLLGNGVVPQQAGAAIEYLAEQMTRTRVA